MHPACQLATVTTDAEVNDRRRALFSLAAVLPELVVVALQITDELIIFLEPTNRLRRYLSAVAGNINRLVGKLLPTSHNEFGLSPAIFRQLSTETGLTAHWFRAATHFPQ
jgi:hypothetical protein